MEMQMEMSYVFAVVITGLVVVFAGLILLILFISGIGKIFESLNDSKKAKQQPVVKAEPVKAVPEEKKIQETVPDTDDDEVIAVISAAVAMMAAAENKNYRIKSVRPAKKKSNTRNVWAMAGIRENTNPF